MPRRTPALLSAALALGAAFPALPPAAAAAAAAAAAESRPNIVFLVVESTDGRTWRKGYQGDVVPLPNLRALESGPGGASFHRHYANAPVCCPSRATFWSGRHAHNIPHEHNGFEVGGAWNNYEGLPSNFTDRIDQVLGRNGYNVKISGKEDWSSGEHSLNVRLNSWTMYARFPYSINQTGGWRDETSDCHNNGTVLGGAGSAHQGDWDVLAESTRWLKAAALGPKPFFVYQGMNIVHPPYATSEEWYDKIDPRRVTVPYWPPVETLHPCDFQSSMLKGCIASNREQTAFYDPYRRRNIRRIYYAMIAEVDAMVGKYMEAVRDAGVWNSTVFIVTSDHGDMQMEHQQHYKMTPYDASASVPMVIADLRSERSPRTIDTPTQLIDIFPTVMELAGVERSSWPKALNGESLVPLLVDSAESVVESKRPPFVVSQFHGCNIAMSWFLVVKKYADGRTYKLIRYGTGREVPSLLFDLLRDPDEMENLAGNSSLAPVVDDLDRSLRSVVDYPSVARGVASYNRESFVWWMNTTGDWRKAIHKSGLRWTDSWNYDSQGAFEAVQEWLDAPAGALLPCRSSLQWPPTV